MISDESLLLSALAGGIGYAPEGAPVLASLDKDQLNVSRLCELSRVIETAELDMQGIEGFIGNIQRHEDFRVGHYQCEFTKDGLISIVWGPMRYLPPIPTESLIFHLNAIRQAFRTAQNMNISIHHGLARFLGNTRYAQGKTLYYLARSQVVTDSRVQECWELVGDGISEAGSFSDNGIYIKDIKMWIEELGGRMEEQHYTYQFSFECYGEDMEVSHIGTRIICPTAAFINELKILVSRYEASLQPN